VAVFYLPTRNQTVEFYLLTGQLIFMLSSFAGEG
jgi:hypothetical protein